MGLLYQNKSCRPSLRVSLCLSKQIGSGNMLSRFYVLQIFIKWVYKKFSVIYPYYALQFVRHSSIHLHVYAYGYLNLSYVALCI